MDQPQEPRAHPIEIQSDATQPGKAMLFGLLAVLLWSTVATGFKLGLAQMSVAQLLLLGTTLSWGVFAAVCLWRRAFTLHPQDRWLGVVLGLIKPLTYYLVLFAAYDRLPAHIAQPLNYTWAITLALLAVPILKQCLPPSAWLGIGLSYAGVVALLSLSDAAQHGWDWLGVFLALFSTLLWALYWLLNTRSQSDPVSLMLYGFTIALPPLAWLCWWQDGWPALTTDNLLYGAWVGFIEMGITFLLWQRALKLTDAAAKVAQLIFISPVVSLVLIYFVLGETISSGAILGFLLILAGLALTQRQS